MRVKAKDAREQSKGWYCGGGFFGVRESDAFSTFNNQGLDIHGTVF